MSLLVLNILLFHRCAKIDDTNNAPSCEIIFPSEGEECVEGDILPITVDSDDFDGKVTEVSFFVDGNVIGSVSNVPYTYKWNTNGVSIGAHALKAISTDDGGKSTSDEIIIKIVEKQVPISAFMAIPPSGSVPLLVNFLDQSNYNPISWKWEFGDGSNSTEQAPSHTYDNAGTYIVNLIVSNNIGSDSITTIINVTDPFVDTRDSQIYNIIVVGDQTWFGQNLNYEIENSMWYDNNIENGNLYGRLYTYDAAKKACPDGWELPSDNDWKTLEMYVGMSQDVADLFSYRGTDEGKKLKSTSGWFEDTDGTDEVGFKVLPGGLSNSEGACGLYGSYGSFWTSTEANTTAAWFRGFGSSYEIYRWGKNKKDGYSVRCIK